MKHYTAFLTNKTHYTKVLGKLATSLSFEIKDKEVTLNVLKAKLDVLDKEIALKSAPLYNTYSDFTTDAINAQKQAYNWNNEPIENHKPIKKNKK